MSLIEPLNGVHQSPEMMPSWQGITREGSGVG